MTVAAAAAAGFARAFGAAPEGVWCAPGRVNLIGEHVDYAGGLCLPLALSRVTAAAVRRRHEVHDGQGSVGPGGHRRREGKGRGARRWLHRRDLERSSAESGARHVYARRRVGIRDSDFASGHGLLAVRLQHRIALGPARLELLARVDNLADREVAGSVIVNEGNARFFEPAPGRSWLLSARLALPF